MCRSRSWSTSSLRADPGCGLSKSSGFTDDEAYLFQTTSPKLPGLAVKYRPLVPLTATRTHHLLSARFLRESWSKAGTTSSGSKFLHRVLPDLVPPIDRQYTFNFFTGQKMVASDRAAFQDWFPRLADIGVRCQEPIRDAIARGGFMATGGEAKVIDNAIMGFMQRLRPRSTRDSSVSGPDSAHTSRQEPQKPAGPPEGRPAVGCVAGLLLE